MSKGDLNVDLSFKCVGCAGRMSAHRGRPPSQSQSCGQTVPIPSATFESLGESSGNWRQKMGEVQGTLARLTRVVDQLATNHEQEEQAPLEDTRNLVDVTTNPALGLVA